MNYKVHDSKRGKVFATMEEANGYANEIARKTGYILLVTETNANVTHTYEK